MHAGSLPFEPPGEPKVREDNRKLSDGKRLCANSVVSVHFFINLLCPKKTESTDGVRGEREKEALVG